MEPLGKDVYTRPTLLNFLVRVSNSGSPRAGMLSASSAWSVKHGLGFRVFSLLLARFRV